MTTDAFIATYREADVASLALQLRRYPEVEAAFALQQIEGWQRARHKLPELAANPDWHWPRRLSLEQASSEVTAKYKVGVCTYPSAAKGGGDCCFTPILGEEPLNKSVLVDLTGGLGVDCYYLSELFDETHYVERDEALCALARHNFAITGRKITVHHCEAEAFLEEISYLSAAEGGTCPTLGEECSYPSAAKGGTCLRCSKQACLFVGLLAQPPLSARGGGDCCFTPTLGEEFSDRSDAFDQSDLSGITIFLDPARRDKSGGKVFRLQDCTPDVTALLPRMQVLAKRILIKLSPMLDITEALRALGGAKEVHVVAVKNEVKELLILLEEGRNTLDPIIRCVNLETPEEAFSFRRSEERGALYPSAGQAGTSPTLGEELMGTLRYPSAGQAGTSPTLGEEFSYPSAAKGGTSPTLGEELMGALSSAEEFLLIEPNAAILKAGAYRTFGERFSLSKLGENTQLYVARELLASGKQEVAELLPKIVPNSTLPGRVFRVHVATKAELAGLKKANIICRNYPLTPEALKKKLRLTDGGETYVIGARVGDKPTLFVGERQFLHT